MALLAAIKSLDTWAGPIKSAAAAVALTSDASGAGAGAGGEGGEGGGEGSPAPPRDREVREVAGAWGIQASQMRLPHLFYNFLLFWILFLQELRRILGEKETKDALLSGTRLFNQNAVKGGFGGRELDIQFEIILAPILLNSSSPRVHVCVRYAHVHAGLRQLVASGVVRDASPAAAAAFLREHAPRLDKAQVGELMGHHDQHCIEVSRSEPVCVWVGGGGGRSWWLCRCRCRRKVWK